MSLRSAVRRKPADSSNRLPQGIVTFLLTDVEASAIEWDADADRMDEWLRDLDDHLRAAVVANGGNVIKTRGEGDSAFAVFERASSGVLAAYELQRTLASHPGLSVRAAIHTGEARCRDGDYFGIIPTRTARLRSLAHGGQTITSRVTAELAESELPADVSLFRLGTYRVRDWSRAEQIFELRGPGLDTNFPPLRVWGDTQRALMTIVASDIQGSLDALANMTAPQIADAQRSLSAVLADVFKEHSGAFYKFLGDGCLALFDDPITALSFAQRLVVVRPEVRVGLHAGVVELAGDDVVGQPVYAAFLVCRCAMGGEIVASPVVADLLAGQGLPLVERIGDGGRRVFALD